MLRGRIRRSSVNARASKVAGTRNGGLSRRMVRRTTAATDSGVARDARISFAMNGDMLT